MSPQPNIVERWSRASLRAKGVAVLAVPLAALFAALVSVYSVEGDVGAADQMVVHTYDMRAELVRLHSSLMNAETAAGGHLATGQSRFLSVFETERVASEHSVDRLAALVAARPAGDAGGHSEIADIRRLAAEELGILSQLVHSQLVHSQLVHLPAGALESATLALLERGKAVMGQVQARLSLLGDYQERLLAQARFHRDMARRRLFRTAMLCGILGPLGALFVHLLLAGRLARRLNIVRENARRLAHGLPLEPSPAGTDEIAALGLQVENADCLLREREGKLRESERRYRELFDQAPIPYAEINREGAVHRFNQAVCSLLKCAPDRMIGRPAWDFLAPDRQEEYRVALMKRMASGQDASPFECECLLEDGSRIAVEIRENPIRNDRGEVTGVCRSLLDITARNLAAAAAHKVEEYAMELRSKNEQLARALETARSATAAKSRFLAGVSHELRTPLNGIIGFSEMLYDARLGPVDAGQREVLSDILSSARHLLQLINDILDLSKVEAGRMEFRPERTAIETLVREVCEVVRPLAEKKALQLGFDVPEGLTANLDPGRFKQVLYNYLSNAMKFTPRGGSVRVRVARDGDSCFRLEVEDTGIGIAPGEVAQLFQEFRQLPNSRKAEQGTGLGLAVTRHIVEAQGGTVAARSLLGSGSVFSAVLPLDR
jgi:PAS domain S-box-containing protein